MISERDRRQIEAELRLHPSRVAALEEIRARYAQQLPPPWSGAVRSTAGTRKIDATWRSLERLLRDREYRRLVRVVRAVVRLHSRLDAQARRVLEAYYWQDMPEEAVAREIGASERTVRRRREEIIEAALVEFMAAGVDTFSRVV